jgi:hypothetical protein
LTLNDKSKFTLANNTEFEVTSFLLTKNKREGTFNLLRVNCALSGKIWRQTEWYDG